MFNPPRPNACNKEGHLQPNGRLFVAMYKCVRSWARLITWLTLGCACRPVTALCRRYGNLLHRVVPVQAMKAYVRVRLWIFALGGGERSASGPGRFISRKGPRCPFYRRLVGPPCWSGRFGEEKTSADSALLLPPPAAATCPLCYVFLKCSRAIPRILVGRLKAVL